MCAAYCVVHGACCGVYCAFCLRVLPSSSPSSSQVLVESGADLEHPFTLPGSHKPVLPTHRHFTPLRMAAQSRPDCLVSILASNGASDKALKTCLQSGDVSISNTKRTTTSGVDTAVQLVLEAQLRGERRWCGWCGKLSSFVDLGLCGGCQQVGYVSVVMRFPLHVHGIQHHRMRLCRYHVFV